MKRMLFVVLAALPDAASAGALEDVAVVEKSGDVLQVGVPLVALGLTFLLDEPDAASFDLRLNGSPRHDLGLAVARTEMTTYSMKYGIDAQRPNGGGQSFPSGHTAVAFTGAEFIRDTYGWGWGIPAYLAAGFVGWSRVVSHNHYPRDVLAGAAIGVLSNHEFSELHLPFGTLSISSGLTFPSTPRGLAIERPLVDAEPLLSGGVPSSAPGLRFELRF